MGKTAKWLILVVVVILVVWHAVQFVRSPSDWLTMFIKGFAALAH